MLASLLECLFCVVRAARQRARDDLPEALGETHVSQAREFLRGYEFDDVEVTLGRLEILPQREDVDAGVAGRVHRRRDLRLGLPESEHQGGLGIARLPARICVTQDL